MSLFDDYLHTICVTETYDEAFDTYRQYIESIGYQSVTYSFIPHIMLDNALLLPQPLATKETHVDHLKYYAETDYDRKNNILKNIKNGCVKTIDWWEEARNKKLTLEQEQMLHTLRDTYQIINGLSVPILVGNKRARFFSASIVSADNDRLFQKLKEETEDTLHVSTMVFHNRVVANACEFHVFTQPLLAGLSKTEKKVIKILPKGATATVIAEELNRSQGYIENVIRELRKKVGGETSDRKPRISTGLLIYYIGLMSLLDQF